MPKSTIDHVVSGLESNALRMYNVAASSAAVPTSSKYTYNNIKDLAVTAGVSALAALVMHPSDIQAVSDAGGMHALIMVLMRYDDHMQVCNRACFVLTFLAPLDAEKGVFRQWDGLEKVTSALYKHRASRQMQTNAIALLAAFVLPSAHKQKFFPKGKVVRTLHLIMDEIASLKDKDVAQSIIKACSP